jgi:hypothetical protein
VQAACMQFFLKSKNSSTIIDLKRKKKKKKVKIGNDSPHVGSMQHTLLGDEICQ